MKTIIVDDDKIVSSSLKTIIESDKDIQVIAIGKNGNEAIELYNTLKPDILLMDIQMADSSGIEASEKILNTDKNAKILLLTTFANDEYIIKALKLGVKGYLLKQNFEDILPAIKSVYANQTVFGENVINKIPTLFKKNEEIDLSKYNITDRELEIIKLIAEGLSNKEISNKLYISEGSVRNLITSILEKLSLRDRTQLAIFYLKNK